MLRSVRMAALLTLALALVSGAAVPLSSSADAATAGSESGNVGIRLLDVPVATANDPRAKQYIIDDLKPGTTIQRRIEISNSTDTVLHVNVYPAAATIAHGSFVGDPGRKANDLSRWSSMSEPSLDVPAHDILRDTVTVAVPADAAPGEQYAVIWAEVSNASGGTITEVDRAGIRLYVAVSGNNPPATSFSVDTFTAERDSGGRPVVLAQIHNTGGRAIDLSGTLSLVKVSGSVAVGPYPVTLGTTLAPGQSEPVKVLIPDELVNGPWKATISLVSGLTHVSAHAQITFPKSGAAKAVPVQTGSGPWFLAAGIALAALLAGALVLAIAWRRRIRREG